MTGTVPQKPAARLNRLRPSIFAEQRPGQAFEIRRRDRHPQSAGKPPATVQAERSVRQRSTTALHDARLLHGHLAAGAPNPSAAPGTAAATTPMPRTRAVASV